MASMVTTGGILADIGTAHAYVPIALVQRQKIKGAIAMDINEEMCIRDSTYTRIFLLFTPFFMMNYVFSAFVRNDNAPTLAMIGTMMGSFSNVVLDYVFMFPMGMGLAGAALATAASPIVSILICSIHFCQKKNTVQFAKTRPSVRMLTASCQLGVPRCV